MSMSVLEDELEDFEGERRFLLRLLLAAGECLCLGVGECPCFALDVCF